LFVHQKWKLQILYRLHLGAFFVFEHGFEWTVLVAQCGKTHKQGSDQVAKPPSFMLILYMIMKDLKDNFGQTNTYWSESWSAEL